MTYLGLFQQNMLKSHSIQNKCDGQVHTAIFKMNHQQGPIEQHMELCTMLCASLDWRDVRGRMDTCISRAESAAQLEGNGNPLQYSCLESPMDRGAWRATVHGVAKSRIRLSNFTSLFT